jgi:phosphohistidine phosphatase SixA
MMRAIVEQAVMTRRVALRACAGVAAFSIAGRRAFAQQMAGSIRKVDAHMGEMVVEMATPVDNVADDSLQFEPMDMLQDLFRPDVVFLMRHGPTDWSKLDIKDVAPTDCTNQRVLSPQGAEDMRTLGVLMVANGLRPSMIARSEWCRGHQTVDELLAGAAKADVDYARSLPVEVDPALDLLLALQGAPNVTALRNRISSWTGANKSGPLLIVTHFTNIEELTQFTVYEGEMLVIDPKRKNRVLGYLRLRSAGPDIGHFDTENTDLKD